ncbi:MAG: hypothetical protein ACP5OE_09650 [Thermodesulfobium sp.]
MGRLLRRWGDILGGTMNLGEWRNIKRILRSLRDSTYLRLQFKNETIILDNRNSPYYSHISVTFNDEGHGREGVIYLSNKKVSLVVHRYNTNDTRVDIPGIRQERIPGFYIKPLLFDDYVNLKWLDGIVWIVYPDGFAGFNEDGSPQYSNIDKWVTIDGYSFRVRCYDYYGDEEEYREEQDL